MNTLFIRRITVIAVATTTLALGACAGPEVKVDMGGFSFKKTPEQLRQEQLREEQATKEKLSLIRDLRQQGYSEPEAVKIAYGIRETPQPTTIVMASPAPVQAAVAQPVAHAVQPSASFQSQLTKAGPLRLSGTNHAIARPEQIGTIY